jgi:hypothetical protein|tara:strand:- start:222 stop:656 length:435 start_codon:yes stop_codon:yes gene_type:complete
MVNTVTYRAHEVLDKVSKAKTKADKLKLLQKENNNWALKDILRGTFDDAVQWILPTGPVPYEPAPFDSHPSEWSMHNKKLASFVKGGPGTQMKTYQREKMFLDILETIHPRDAELLVGMINKKMPIKGITKKLTKEAFPDLILK